MKKLLLLGAGLSMAFCLQAQHRPAKVNSANANKALPVQKEFLRVEGQLPASTHSTTSPYLHRTSQAVTEAIIGTTEYDLQTNRSTANRVSNNGDGTISAVWTGSHDRNGWPDRGSWYNYWDGTMWTGEVGPLEPVRTGFSNLNMVNNIEYVLTHNGGGEGQLSTRTKGTGTWSTTGPVGGALPTGYSDIWFRMAVGGANNMTVHAIVNSQGSGTTPVLGQNGPVTYSRSQDGGVTWDIQRMVLPGMDSTMYWGFSAEDYHIDCKGDIVAIVLGGFSNDVVLMKSTDNGNTWTKTVVYAYPDQAYMSGDPTPAITDPDGDGVADTLETNGGDVTVTLDAGGMAHVAFSFMRNLDDDPTATDSYFPGSDGIIYWNESMPQITDLDLNIIAGVEDLNGDGVVSIPQNASWAWGLYNCGLSQQPSIGFDAAGNMFMAYATINELTDTTIFQQVLRHVYVIGSTDGGVTWSTPYNVVPMAAQGGDGEFQEAVFPSMAKVVDSDVYIEYQRDIAPGHSLSGDATQAANNTTTNDIILVKVPVTDILTGVNEVNSASKNFSISQNYPNPFSGSTSFELTLSKNSDVTVEVYNVLGKLVQVKSFENMMAGVNRIAIDGNDFASGIYTYSVTVGTEKVSNNMMVK
jgi:hypothetical protein